MKELEKETVLYPKIQKISNWCHRLVGSGLNMFNNLSMALFSKIVTDE
jgi:hypothetical protein